MNAVAAPNVNVHHRHPPLPDSTANYVARRFGVRSAMPGFIGVRLCPELVFVEPNFEKYRTASNATRRIFADFDPNFEAGSLDEAYLDITDYCQQHSRSGGWSISALHVLHHRLL